MTITNLEACCNPSGLFDAAEAAKHGVSPGQILSAMLSHAAVQLGAFYAPMLGALERDTAAGEGDPAVLGQLLAHRKEAEALYLYANSCQGVLHVPGELAILLSNLIAGMGAALEAELSRNGELHGALHSRVVELVKAVEAEGPVH